VSLLLTSETVTSSIDSPPSSGAAVWGLRCCGGKEGRDGDTDARDTGRETETNRRVADFKAVGGVRTQPWSH